MESLSSYMHDSLQDSMKDSKMWTSLKEEGDEIGFSGSLFEGGEFYGLDDLLEPPTHPFKLSNESNDLDLRLLDQFDNWKGDIGDSDFSGPMLQGNNGRLKKRRRSSILAFAKIRESAEFKPRKLAYKPMSPVNLSYPLSRATKKQSGKKDLLFKCPEKSCTQGFERAELLKIHLESSHGNDKDLETNYRELALTSTYIVANNDGSQTYICPFPGCSCKFRRSNCLMKHMDEHKKGNRRYFKCEMCNQTFYSAGCLKSHRISHFKDTTKYVCKVVSCGKQYSTAEGLRLHIRNHHQVNKKWKCMSPGCVRSFVRQADLRMHIVRVHTVERPFPCKSKGCNKAFACHSELRRHASAFHNVSIPAMSSQGKQYAQPALVSSLLEKAVDYQKRMGLK